MQNLTNLTEIVSKLTSALTMHKKWKFYVQPKPDLKSQQHPQMNNLENQNISQVKSAITLRGGKIIEKHIWDPRKISKDSISKDTEVFVEPLTYKEITNSPHVPLFSQALIKQKKSNHSP